MSIICFAPILFMAFIGITAVTGVIFWTKVTGWSTSCHFHLFISLALVNSGLSALIYNSFIFQALWVSAKNHRNSKNYGGNLAESKGFEPSKPCLRLTRFPIVLLRPARTTLRFGCALLLYIRREKKSSLFWKFFRIPSIFWPLTGSARQGLRRTKG